MACFLECVGSNNILLFLYGVEYYLKGLIINTVSLAKPLRYGTNILVGLLREML
jgi:hypothetical protein